MSPVALGIDTIFEQRPQWLRRARVGLLANQASVDRHLCHSRDRLLEAGVHLSALFAPQHGYHGDKQANMIESDDFVDLELNVPVFSLYGRTRKPTPEMLAHIDLLLIDLQDVGTRVYTFATTISYCLEACRDCGVEVVVLDRPNPIGGTRIEGNLLEPDRASFVGRYPVPMRHGLTIGELARLMNAEFGIGAPLEIYPLQNWERWMLWQDTGLPWVPPSPNLPTPQSTLVYPGQVVLEGTNLSEGRGTTTPFELWGAPYLQTDKFQGHYPQMRGPGYVLRPAHFVPCFDKWCGHLCHGYQIHVTAPRTYSPYLTSLQLLQAVIRSHPGDFSWSPPPYEYEDEHLPIEFILGSSWLHQQLESPTPVKEIAAAWSQDLEEYWQRCQPHLLYR